MKPEDLMIGDWFRVRYAFDGKDFVRTFRISKTVDDLGFVCGKGFGPVCLPEELEPIPLTSEILENNGFQCRELCCWSLLTRFVNIRIKRTDKWYIMIRKKDEKGESEQVSYYRDWAKNVYVHELQHALRLCRIDKEIVLLP